ncbi:MAG: hypothetical protein E7182_01380 [Erysipelotrichaceae bacterium]|nr:hypothetical protein [Erysipelotrichaceae bacterium]
MWLKSFFKYGWPFLVGAAVLSMAISFGLFYAFHPEVYGGDRERVFSTLLILGASLLIIVVIVEFVSPFIVSDATWNTAGVALSILVAVITSRAFLVTVGFHPSGTALDNAILILLDMVRFLSYLTALVFLFRFASLDEKAGVLHRTSILSVAILVADFLLYVGLYWVGLEWVAVVIAFLVGSFWVVSLINTFSRAKTWTVIIGFTITIFLTLSFMVLSESVGRAYPSLYVAMAPTAVFSLALPLFFFSIYLSFTIRIGKAVVEKERAEQKLQEMQANILRNQTSSHFLFNTLTFIKSFYRLNPDKGDLGIDLLSRYLRSYTDAGDTYLVPLTKELELLSDYLELHNLKGDKPLTLLFNIEDDGYEVPYFSLQPLLENVIRYSGIADKADGYVKIDSYRDGDRFVLSFADNGVGFDMKKIRADSVGLRNVESRFKILLNAETKIESEPGEGTKITFFIPIKPSGEEKR